MLAQLDAMGGLLRYAGRLSMQFASVLQNARYIVAMSPQRLRGLQ
jgi:hypothetical protein